MINKSKTEQQKDTPNGASTAAVIIRLGSALAGLVGVRLGLGGSTVLAALLRPGEVEDRDEEERVAMVSNVSESFNSIGKQNKRGSVCCLWHVRQLGEQGGEGDPDFWGL